MNRQPVASSNLVSVGYDEENQTLEIEFNKSTYRYFEVPNHVYEELMSADSKGTYHHLYIKTAYPYERI
ncbi:TPA: KTSC domain-containing protein [Vibrio parahaemolyticus]|nr:KTSC domain-containing protein [Vibrio parahaemolyticus]